MSLQPQQGDGIATWFPAACVSPGVFLRLPLTAVVVKSQLLVLCRAGLVLLWPWTELLLSFPILWCHTEVSAVPWEQPQTLWSVRDAHPESHSSLWLCTG